MNETQERTSQEVIRDLVAEHGSVDFELVGSDSNAGAIMGNIRKAARDQGWPREAWQQLPVLLMSAGTYDDLLYCAMIVTGDAD